MVAIRIEHAGLLGDEWPRQRNEERLIALAQIGRVTASQYTGAGCCQIGGAGSNRPADDHRRIDGLSTSGWRRYDSSAAGGAPPVGGGASCHARKPMSTSNKYMTAKMSSP